MNEIICLHYGEKLSHVVIISSVKLNQLFKMAEILSVRPNYFFENYLRTTLEADLRIYAYN